MPLTGEYEPSPSGWVRDQVTEYEASGGTRANTLRNTGLPVVVITYRGPKSGKIRKMALMRIEDGGRYALVASAGGQPANPQWYSCLKAEPAITIQDGPAPVDYVVREADGDEYQQWWDRAVAGFAPYASYQEKTTRRIPLFVAEPA